MPGARLLGGDRRVGHEVHGSAHDPRTVAGEDDGAVHLAQFAQAGGGELDVQREPAGADRRDHPVVPEHDECTRTAAQDAFEPVAQYGPRRHQSQRCPQWIAAGACRDSPADTAGTRAGTGGVAVDRHPHSLRIVIQPALLRCAA